MRVFELVINGKTYQVEIGALSQSPIKVTVDGQEYAVEVVMGDASESASGIAVEPKGSIPSKMPAPTVPRQAPKAKQTPADGAEITAPMPGKILSVTVSVGDHVEAGQVLCTLEAMKMEMAINSTTRGAIIEVSVEPGQTVNHGDTLCVIG